MPKASRKAAPSAARKGGGNQGKSNKDQQYPAHHPYADRDSIVVHDNDVLNGRGVNMAHHPGNERFRALVQTRSDPSYCSNYSLDEKKALAEEIVNHIESLDPPGRFLKRGCKNKSKKSPEPWELMTREEAMKKARQALRDCNRPDRVGYAKSVAAPSDVTESALQRRKTGLSQQEYVQSLVAANPPSASNSGRSTPNSASASKTASKRNPAASPVLSHTTRTASPVLSQTTRTASPVVSRTTRTNGRREPPSHLDWLDKTNMGDEPDPHDSTDPSVGTPHLRTTTPTTAATSTCMFTDDPDHYHFHHHHHHHSIVDVAGAPTLDSPTHHSHFGNSLPDSPQAEFEQVLADSFNDDDIKPRAVSSFNHPDHDNDSMQEEADAAALASAFDADFLFN